MSITIDEFLAFARANDGARIPMLSGEKTFLLESMRSGARFIPRSGKPRPLKSEYILEYLEIYNRTGSLKTTDYAGDLRNSSYVLGVIREMVRRGSSESVKRTFRTEASYEAEKITRGLLPEFLRERGFQELRDERKSFGQTQSQIVHALDPSGRQVRLWIRLCWRKDDQHDGHSYSAAQLISKVKDNDWMGSLRNRLSRAREFRVTHLLLVQRSGDSITYCASIPLEAVIPIWTAQRDISQKLANAGRLGKRRKNHAMNGSSPTLWLQDTQAPGVAEALWDYPGVADLAKMVATRLEPNDTEADLPGLDPASLGSDGAARVEIRSSGVKRDPKVREHVRRRSKGRCERLECAEERNFPGFIDVHHILGAEKGDRVWNCIALCPNCHRESHFSPTHEKLNEKLLAFVKNLEGY